MTTNMSERAALLLAAEELHAAGLSVVPVKGDGTKVPAVAWTEHKTRRATLTEIRAWISTGLAAGIGVVCGAVSGNLVMVELEGLAVAEGLLERIGELAADNGLHEQWLTLATGFVESSPRGGVHFHAFVDGTVPGNTKLASRLPTEAELKAKPTEKIKGLAETRGEGGFTVMAPSGGGVHPNGRAWERRIGSPATIPTISQDDHDALMLLIGMTDQMPVPEYPAPSSTTSVSNRHDRDGEVRPGDDYAARHTWGELLTERGWTLVRRIGDEECWLRPGKKLGEGISATTGRGGYDNLYVFSTSAGLPTEVPLSKLAFLAHTEHGGDMKAAVKALAASGYGSRPEPVTLPRPALTLVHSAPREDEQATGTDGAALARAAHPSSQPALTSEVSLTEDGNARLLLERHGQDLRYAPGVGWIAWTGQVWAGGADEGRRLAAQRLTETVHAIEAGTDKELLKHKVRSLNYRPLVSSLAQASDLAAFQTDARLLGARGDELATPGGTVNLRTAELRPAQREAFHMHLAGYTPQRGPTPLWDAFLTDTFGQDPDIVAYVQRLVGYSATGDQGGHVLPFLLGNGANGKSVFARVVMKALGSYATTASSTFLMGGRGSSFETELARLHGVRFVLCSEVGPRDQFDEQRIKLLTGGDEIMARHLYQRHFTFDPTHHLVLVGNHQPRVDAGGDSFWRRLRLVNFPHQVPKAKRDGTLADRLLAEEGPGILAWIIDGAVDYFARGLQDPESVLRATAEYAREEDALGRYVLERCHVDGGNPGYQVDSGKVRSSYVAWCQQEGEQPLAPPHFGRELRARFGVTTRPSHGRRFFVGMTLLDGTDDAHP